MNIAAVLVLLALPLMLGQAIADESGLQHLDFEVTTEAGALAVVDHIVSKLEAAVPTPTPDEQR